MEKQKTWPGQKSSIFIILLCSAFPMTGCEPSFKERQAKREAERKELIHKKEAKIKILSDQLSEKYNPISFPPKGSGATVFTYELQRFLYTNAERAILFKGYLEDVEKTERGIVVEFLLPLGKDFFVDKTAIRIRLVAAEERIEQFLVVKREPMFRLFRYFAEPEYLIVAKL